MIIIVILVLVLIFVKLERKYCLNHWDENLRIETSFSRDMVGVNEKFDIIENIYNNKRLPLPIFRIKFQTGRDLFAVALQSESVKSLSDKFYYTDSMSIRSYEELERRIECVCKKRGIYAIEELFLTTHDLLMFDTLHDKIKASAFILVYPDRVDYDKMQFRYNQLNGEILARIQYLVDPFEFKGIREYLPGDSVRNINFKASARSQEIMVNTFNQTISRSVCIVCDTSNNHQLLSDYLIEQGLRLSKTLAEDLLVEGYEVSLASNGVDYFNGQQIKVNTGSGVKHLGAIHEALAIIDLNKNCTDLNKLDLFNEVSSNDTFYIIISSNQTEDMINFFTRFVNGNKDAFWIVPTDRMTEYLLPKSLGNVATEWKTDGH